MPIIHSRNTMLRAYQGVSHFPRCPRTVTAVRVVGRAMMSVVKYQYKGIKIDAVVQKSGGLSAGQGLKDAMDQMPQVRT